jgi:hypothetical protein
MTRPLLAALVLACLAACSPAPTAIEPWYQATNAGGDPLFAVFESRIPCADCQTIKFALVLYRDRASGAPSTYRLARVHVGKGDERTVSEGTWRMARGTKLDPQALVYQLDANAPVEFRAFWAIGRDLLFILDRDLQPRLGTAGYGYALNRTR